MSIVYLGRGDDRRKFVSEIFRIGEVPEKAAGQKVLIKPNIVSHEPYPTTTHPDMLEACLSRLKPTAREIIIGDGPAFDAGKAEPIIREHPLTRTGRKFGIIVCDLPGDGTQSVRTAGLKLDVASVVFQCDFLVSLPVLKSHGICGLTGALKNHLGILAPAQKRQLHWKMDVNRVIAALNRLVKPQLYIVDAVQTMIITNEIRHGGRVKPLGYLLAGADPVSLDVAGLELLKEVEPRLRGKTYRDIPHIRYAVELGAGEPEYQIKEISL